MAIALYQNYGFQFNGELDTKGEKVMVLEAAQREMPEDGSLVQKGREKAAAQFCVAAFLQGWYQHL